MQLRTMLAIVGIVTGTQRIARAEDSLADGCYVPPSNSREIERCDPGWPSGSPEHCDILQLSDEELAERNSLIAEANELCDFVHEMLAKKAEMDIYRKHVDMLKKAIDELRTHANEVLLLASTTQAAESEALFQGQVSWWTDVGDLATSMQSVLLSVTDWDSYLLAREAIEEFEAQVGTFDDSAELLFLDETARMKQQISAFKQALLLLRNSDNFGDLKVTRDTTGIAAQLSEIQEQLTSLYSHIDSQEQIVHGNRAERRNTVAAISSSLLALADASLQASNAAEAWKIVEEAEAVLAGIRLQSYVNNEIDRRARVAGNMQFRHSCPRLTKRELRAAATWIGATRAAIDEMVVSERTLAEVQAALDSAITRFDNEQLMQFLDSRLAGYYAKRTRTATLVEQHSDSASACVALARGALKHNDGIESELAYRRMEEQCM